MEKLEESIIQTFLKSNQYQYQKVLGKGDFSQVVMAFSQKQQCQVAIKILKKLQGNNQVDQEEFDKEILVLSKLKNEKYVLQIVDKIQDEKQGLAAIVTELCDCNLTTIFELNKLDIDQVVALTYQLLKGLIILQENGIIHSDIKPDNILFSKFKNQFLIADYGLSKIIKDPSSQKTLASLKGNDCYKSPEVMDKQKPYTITVDVFSIGQLLIEAFIQRRLQGMEWILLKSQNLLTVLPSLQSSPNIEFVNKILSKMVEPNKNTRLQPITLLQTLKTLFDVNENSLKQLKVSVEAIQILNIPKQPQNQLKLPEKPPKELKKLNVSKIEDIIKGKDYDILEINLTGDGIGQDGAKKVSDALSKCSNITQLILYLRWNGIGSDGAKEISGALRNCPNITQLTLYLSSNSISDDGAKSVANAIQNCQKITHLELWLLNNKIGDSGAQSIVNAIQNCQKITSLGLWLYSNNISQGQKQLLENSLRSKFGGIQYLSLLF